MTKDKYLATFISPSVPDIEGEGIVKSLSYAPVEGLGKSLGWISNGSLAMTTQIENGKKILVQWERNGHRRGHFDM